MSQSLRDSDTIAHTSEIRSTLDALSRTVPPDDRDPRWPAALEVLTRENDEAAFAFYINRADQPAQVAVTGTELLHGEAAAGSLTVPPGEARVVVTEPQGVNSRKQATPDDQQGPRTVGPPPL